MKIAMNLYFCLVTLNFISLTNSYDVVRFPGGGIYFWWQAGAATYLLENQNVDSMQLIGSSAGSITAALLLAKADFQQAAKIAIGQVEELQLWSDPRGLAGVWGPLLENFLQQLILPANLTSQDLNRIYITATPRLIFRGTEYLADFETKDELINAVLASTHIPFFMDGRPWKSFKGKNYIDGSFWSFLLHRKPKLPLPILEETISHFEAGGDWQGSPRPLVKHVRGLTEDRLIGKKIVTVLDVEYQQDLLLMEQMKGVSFVKLITPEKLYLMMELGYNYMRKHANNHIY